MNNEDFHEEIDLMLDDYIKSTSTNEKRQDTIHAKGFDSVKKVTGLALDSISETTDILERDTIIFPQFNHDTCLGCGRCVISCADGGHQAIHLNEKRQPILDGKKCVGCHLCRLVCPTHSIFSAKKRISRQH